MAIKILVVDDDSQVRPMFVSVLHGLNLGAIIFEAEDGEAALELIREHEFNLIISDIVMPKMNGMELMLAIERLSIEIPIIFISGYCDPAIATSIQGAGRIILGKPIKPQNLIVVVKETLGLLCGHPLSPPEVFTYV
ncbi:MAG: Sensor histidine kinase/response regulator [uncultured bacterium]|nr:MAG: Sensor histidine kinase/response regulator [uncultured bacterium]